MAEDLSKIENVKLNKELADAYKNMTHAQQKHVREIFAKKYNKKWEWDVEANFAAEWNKITTKGYDIKWDSQEYKSFDIAIANNGSADYDYIQMLEAVINSVKDEETGKDALAAQANKPDWEKEQNKKDGINGNYTTFDNSYEDVSKSLNYAGRHDITDTELATYGNNIFYLETYDKSSNDKIKLCGVLKEMPEFGVSTTWDDGPGKCISDWIDNFIKDDILETVQFFGGSKNGNGEVDSFQHLVFTDAWTGRIYDKAEIDSISLSFRVYTNDKIGYKETTSAKDWIYYLTAFTPLNAENDVNFTNVFKSLENAHNGGVKVVKQLKDAFAPLKNGEKSMTLEGTVEKLNNTIAKNLNDSFGADRVSNALNKNSKLGAKLFELHFLPFVFKKPIPVCITDWSFTPSKEMNNDEHIYYDFEITCEFDQLPSMESLDTLLN